MNEEIKFFLKPLMADNSDNNDYLGEDGLLYCGKCHTRKQYRPQKPFMGKTVLPVSCKCRQEEMEKRDMALKQTEEMASIRRLKANGIQDEALRNATFAKDNGSNHLMSHAQKYVGHWKEVKQSNVGLLLWGSVGTGKSFFAACIANALLEQEEPVLMTNFSKILNSLSGFGEDRNRYLASFENYRLLIIDDLGMERGTDYALEQVYNVIDSRYKSGKPLIVTTNLSLNQLKEPEDMAHQRIYDRILEMCVPIRFTGENMRKSKGQEKVELLRSIFAEGGE